MPRGLSLLDKSICYSVCLLYLYRHLLHYVREVIFYAFVLKLFFFFFCAFDMGFLFFLYSYYLYISFFHSVPEFLHILCPEVFIFNILFTEVSTWKSVFYLLYSVGDVCLWASGSISCIFVSRFLLVWAFSFDSISTSGFKIFIFFHCLLVFDRFLWVIH